MSAPTPEFVALVKDALERLYDPAHLEAHPLVQVLAPSQLPAGLTSEGALRQVLLESIERLKPSRSPPAASPQGRTYRILSLRYVEALPYHDVMEELMLSQSQYHRDQRHALEAVSTLLWRVAEGQRSRRATGPAELAAPAAPPEAAPTTGREDDLVDLVVVVRGVLAMLRRVALEAGVALREELAPGPLTVPGDRTTLRQLLINLLGYVLGGAGGGELVVSGHGGSAGAGTGVEVTVAYRGLTAPAGLASAEAAERLALARQVLARLGGSLRAEAGTASVAVVVTLPRPGRSLLVIEDNADSVQLITRLLAGHRWSVLSAGSVREGLALARSAAPDAILLDIMIPGEDGWDALQALKNDVATQSIPVLVCTVLGEARLALALGAAEFIRKPLSQAGLLAALARWCPGTPPPAGASPEPSAPSGATG